MRPAGWIASAALVAVAGLLAVRPVRADDATASVGDVERMADAGDVEAAACLAEELLKSRPNDIDLHVVYQDLVLRLDGGKDLQKVYRTRAAGEGATADDGYLLARLLEERAAITEHRRTLKTDPDHVRTLLALGDLYLARNELGDAEEVLAHAVAVAPELAAPRIGMSELRRMSGDLEGAEEHLRAAVEAEPRWVLPRVELGVLLAEAGRYDDARTTLVAAVDVAPEDPLPHMALGHLERMLGRDPVALDEFETRRQAEVDAAAAKAAEAAAAAEKAAEEARAAGKTPPEPPADPPAKPEEVGTSATRAQAAFQKAVDVAPRSFPALILLAHAATAAGDGLTAQASLLTARGLRPDRFEPGVYRSRLQLDQDLVAEAESSADEVLTDHRDLPIALYLRAVARGRLGGLRKAEKDLEKALHESDDNPLYLRALGALDAANGRWRDAVKAFEKAVKATDAAPRCVYELAFVQRGAGKSKDAANTLEALVADDPDNADAWLLLGRICYEDLRKKEQRALECFEQFLDLGGEHPEVADWIAALKGQ